MNWGDYFYYDETSPSGLRRKTEWRIGKEGCTIRRQVGDVAGGMDFKGYWVVKVGCSVRKAHRVVWELHYGVLERHELIDHIDGNKSNNAIANLRKTDRYGNMRNRVKSSKNTSTVTGVKIHIDKRQTPEYVSWVSKWTDERGKSRTKYFAIDVYGDAEAFHLACEHRAEQIRLLNSQGAGYTERHGK